MIAIESKYENKWIRGAIPAILLHISIGSVYAFSLFVKPISEYINQSQGKIQFAFSLAIFFLGMSAAFCSFLVEKNIRKSSFISVVCFCSGLMVTAVAMQKRSLELLYVGYGVLMGCGLGVGYLTPIKTLMLWFKDNKGLATGISVCAFGFASTIASPIITYLMNHYSLQQTFVILSVIYFIPMIIAHLLLKKPQGWIEPQDTSSFRIASIFKDKTFVFIWLIIFINITCGLAVISTASPMLSELKYSPTKIALVISIMGVFNGAGRLVFSSMSDLLRKRIYIYYAIIGISIIVSAVVSVFYNSAFVALVIISACYGAGFSCLPPLLSSIYGMDNISKIHGLSLTAWAMAGLVGNQLSSLIHRLTGQYVFVFIIILILYVIAMMFAIQINKSTSKITER